MKNISLNFLWRFSYSWIIFVHSFCYRNSIDTADVVKVPITQPDVLYNNLDLNKPLVIYVHGFREGPSAENTQTIVDGMKSCHLLLVWTLKKKSQCEFISFIFNSIQIYVSDIYMLINNNCNKYEL